ncbi:TRAP transporter small permease [Grimontia sp. NTOU-MAR1]|uniref:TRAP transporter small permease n=1 Tax=Grimontia sp. NTOU-MAR1 TaxID=3111011 RepID=UPI002DBFA3A9|nr:TRAP transporter small permease [Grimontia sp. NTOU-MAR1]WRW00774.1 TRAP transporter small permease [Grimontia sp. NTOU-MAR1]
MNALPMYIEKGLRNTAFFLALLSAFSLFTIVLVIITSVVLRKFFDAPLYFAEELVGLLLSATLFLGLPMATLNGQHIRVTLMSELLQKRSPIYAKLLSIFSLMIGIGFMGWIFLESIPWMEFAIKRELKSETARILLYPLMSVVPFSIGLCGVIYCAKLFGFIHKQDD